MRTLAFTCLLALVAQIAAADQSVVLELLDQNGDEIAGSTIRVGSQTVTTGGTVVLSQGSHTFTLAPTVLGEANALKLGRTETREVTASTSRLTFEWVTSEVAFHLRDQHGVDIPASVIRLSAYHFSVSYFENSAQAVLAITDDAVYPAIGGSQAGGYAIRIFPGILGESGYAKLFRNESREVTQSTSEISAEWITSEVTFRLGDQHDEDIPGSLIRLSAFHFSVSYFVNGSRATVPITDDTVYPTIGGNEAGGYDLRILPGVAGTPHSSLLHRNETGEVTTVTTEFAFEWRQVVCMPGLVDTGGAPVAGSIIALPSPYPPLTPGDEVRFPVNHADVYPELHGTFATGYPIAITPGDIEPPASETISFAVGSSDVFSPATFEIGGNTYRLTCEVPDTNPPTLLPEASCTVLWPPNHKMAEVSIEANATDNSGGPVVLSVEVTSNEPIEGTGKGNKSPDWDNVVVDSETGLITLDLRRERSGGGDGRVYTVRITATDPSGNAATAEVQIAVPHDRGGKK